MMRLWSHAALLCIAYLCILDRFALAQSSVCPPQPVDDSAESELARYIWELRNNRQANCESGGDFLVDPDEIKYSVKSFCKTDEPSGEILYNITYSFIDCDDNKQKEETVDARVRPCSDAADVLQQPMNLELVEESEPDASYECPDGYTTYTKREFDDNDDFAPDWEFTHLAEAAWKYNLSVVVPTTRPECNSYVSTTTRKACINEETRAYEGYADISSECVSDAEQTTRTLFVKGTLLGDSPRDARSRCPWPEILPGNSGYNANFTFAQKPAQPTSTSSPDLPTTAPTGAPVMTPPVVKPPVGPPSDVAAAVACMRDATIEVTDTNQPELIIQSKVWNLLNDTTLPMAVATPASIEQVQTAVRCLRQNNVRAVPKGGGHSFQGYSVQQSAVTLDLQKITQVNVSSDGKTFTAGGGARLGPVYYSVGTALPGAAVVAGTCPGVGLGGYLLGGGIGLWTHAYGLGCDQLESLKMVDYKGDLIIASETDNQDLFWASCGGGGGNFGIVVEFTTKTVPIPAKFPAFSFSIDPTQANKFISHWQENVTQKAPQALNLAAQPNSDGGVDVVGNFNGTLAGLENALTAAGLSASGPFKRNDFDVLEIAWLDYVVQEAYTPGVDTPENLTNVPALTAERTFAKLKSFFVMPDKPLGAEQNQIMLDWVAKAADVGGYIELTLLGSQSAMAVKKSNETAFPYRDALYSVLYGIEWTDPAENAGNIALVNELEAKLKPFLGDKPPAYINYIDGTVPLSTYYGDNLQRLQTIKQKYDPENYFQSPMSIQPAATEPTPTKPDVPEGPATEDETSPSETGTDVKPAPEVVKPDSSAMPLLGSVMSLAVILFSLVL